MSPPATTHDDHDSTSRAGCGIAALILVLYGAAVAASAWWVGPNTDERLYLATGRHLVQERDWSQRTALYQPPLALYFNQTLTAGIPSSAFVEADIDRRALFLGRLGMLPFALLTGALVFLWSRRAFGPGAGLLSLSIFALDPLMIGYAAFANVDMAHAAGTLLACWCLFLFLERPTPLRLAALGLSAGALLATKYLALALVPFLFAMATWRAVRRAAGRAAERTRGASIGAGIGAGCLAAVGLVAATLLALHASYLFAVDTATADATAYESRLVRSSLAVPGAGALVTLLPGPWIEGLDQLFEIDESEKPVYLMGAYRHRPRSYYAWSLLLKTPEPVLLLSLLVSALVLPRLLAGRGRGAAVSTARICSLAVAAPTVLLSLLSGYKVAIRYLLQVYPPLFVLLGCAVALPFLRGLRPRLRLAIAFVFLAVLGVAGLRYWPNHIAWFGWTAGGAVRGYRYFAGSNCEWGQTFESGRRELATWAPPPSYELKAGEGPRFGRIAVYLPDLIHPAADPARDGSWLQRFEPTGSVDAAWWVFDVTPVAYERVAANDPDPAARAELAVAHLGAGEREAAARVLATLPPGEAEPVRALAERLAAHALQRDDPESAVELARAWLRVHRPDRAAPLLADPRIPSDDDHTLLCVRTMLERQRWDEALAFLESRADAATRPASVLLLAWLYAERGQEDAALGVLDEPPLRAAFPREVEEIRAIAERRSAGVPSWLRALRSAPSLEPR